MVADKHFELLEKLFYDLDRKREEDHKNMLDRIDSNCHRLSGQIQELRTEVKTEVSTLKAETRQLKEVQLEHGQTVSAIKKLGIAASLSMMSAAGIWVWSTFAAFMDGKPLPPFPPPGTH